MVGAIVLLLAYYTTRMTSNDDGSKYDVGVAIMDFGRAFPNEAIRSLHFSADGQGVFVRLYDNRAGFMRKVRGGHYACRLIEPGCVRVQPLETGRGFTIEFVNEPVFSASYEFASTREAAEVSLWLLDNYVRPQDIEALAEGNEPRQQSSDA